MTAQATDRPVQFVPSRVDGLPDVVRATVFPDCLELVTPDRVVTYRFADMARWPFPRLFWKCLARLGWKPAWLPVADRDSYCAPADRYFKFYTRPRLKVCMPVDEAPNIFESRYYCIQQVLRRGGFDTFDLS
jgi:hypothetical protein